MNGIKIELWDLVRFNNAQEEWSNLLERSSSDKLFMSWEWLHSWWEAFANSDDYTLQIIAAYNSDNTLVGLAPLFLIPAKSKKIIKTQRLQFIGNCWRGAVTMRSELQDFIVDKSISTDVIKSLFTFINSLSNWNEFVFSDLDKRSETYQVLMGEKLLDNAYYRYAEDCESYSLSLDSSFEEYCKSLGKNTRLKFFNRRKLLDKEGCVKLVEDNNDIELCFTLLNELHIQRWGKPIFEHDRLAFNIKVAELMKSKGQLNFSILMLDNTPISIQYNYVVAKHEYNIQAGFNENFHNKISLGYLHFGYAIESAFDKGLQYYDFLAGEGKNTQYKKSLTNNSITIASIQVIRSPLAKILYRLYDAYSNLVKSN